jgi:hypothetical protein
MVEWRQFITFEALLPQNPSERRSLPDSMLRQNLGTVAQVLLPIRIAGCCLYKSSTSIDMGRSPAVVTPFLRGLVTSRLGLPPFKLIL